MMRTLPRTGAQKKFVTSFVAALKPHVLSGKVELMLNAGDHEHMRIAFLKAIKVPLPCARDIFLTPLFQFG